MQLQTFAGVCNRFTRLVVAAVSIPSLALLGSGCSHVRDLAAPDQRGRTQYLSGPSVDLDAQDLADYSANQQKVVNEFIRLAGLNGAPATDWKPVVNAGMTYVDRQCERYIDAIFWFNRYKKAAGNQVALVGAATAGTMGILQAAAKEIAVTAVAFGLASETINNIGNTVLYQLEPSGVRHILSQSQATYKKAVAQNAYLDQSSALAAVQGYLTLCLPSTLETEVNNAISNTRFEIAPDTGTVNTVPMIQQVVAPPERIRVGSFDDAAQLLTSYVFKPGTKTPIPERAKAFQECVRQVYGTETPPRPDQLISSPAYGRQRNEVATCLKLM